MLQWYKLHAREDIYNAKDIEEILTVAQIHDYTGRLLLNFMSCVELSIIM